MRAADFRGHSAALLGLWLTLHVNSCKVQLPSVMFDVVVFFVPTVLLRLKLRSSFSWTSDVVLPRERRQETEFEDYEQVSGKLAARLCPSVTPWSGTLPGD